MDHARRRVAQTMTDGLRRAGEGEDWAAVLHLIRDSFA